MCQVWKSCVKWVLDLYPGKSNEMSLAFNIPRMVIWLKVWWLHFFKYCKIYGLLNSMSANVEVGWLCNNHCVIHMFMEWNLDFRSLS